MSSTPAAKLSDLYRYMTIELGACPQAMMLFKLQEAAQELCSQSEAWLEWLDPHRLVDGKLQYTLDWDWCAEIRRIKEVWIKTAADVTNEEDGTKIEPQYYEFDQPDQLTLDDTLEPSVDVSRGLCIKVVFVPHLNTCDLPVWFLQRYSRSIIGYAMSDLMSMPKKSWTNPSRAAHWYSVYTDNLNKAKQEVERGNKDDFVGLRG